MPRQTHPRDTAREQKERRRRLREEQRESNRESAAAERSRRLDELSEPDRWLVVQIERELRVLDESWFDETAVEGARRRIKKALKKASQEAFGPLAAWLRSEGAMP